MEEMVTITITKEQFDTIKSIGGGMYQEAKRWLDTRKWDDPDDGTEQYQTRLKWNRQVAEKAAWIYYDLKPSK